MRFRSIASVKSSVYYKVQLTLFAGVR